MMKRLFLCVLLVALGGMLQAQQLHSPHPQTRQAETVSAFRAPLGLDGATIYELAPIENVPGAGGFLLDGIRYNNARVRAVLGSSGLMILEASGIPAGVRLSVSMKFRDGSYSQPQTWQHETPLELQISNGVTEVIVSAQGQAQPDDWRYLGQARVPIRP